ncbi:MAG: hypothetical protein QM270_01315 [Bacillota bacterium]|nr:hypothetical protein [Bacillota bacterium]
MKCKTCGTENDNRNVCIKCGAFIQGRRLNRYERSPSEKRRDTARKVGRTARSCVVTSLLMVAALTLITVIFLLLFRLFANFLDFSDLPPAPLTDASGNFVTDASGNPVYPSTAESEEISSDVSDITSDSVSPTS